jgi:biopolymer transport protein ExbD
MKIENTRTVLSEINVTPLVDVMLVLLIIFMVCTPMMKQGIPVNLPKTVNSSNIKEPSEQFLLSITKDEKIYLNEDWVALDQLKTKLEMLSKKHPDLELTLQGDQAVPYGIIAQVMAIIKSTHIEKVGLATEPTQVKATKNQTP